MAEELEEVAKGKTETTLPAGAAAGGQPTFLSTLKAWKESLYVYGLLLGLIAALPLAIRHVDKNLPFPNFWVSVGFCALPAILILLWLIPKWMTARYARRMKELGYSGEVKDPRYFRLTPYVQKSDFHRTDGTQTTVYDWLSKSNEPLLYLSGKSGSGKSSIITGWVIPSINEASMPLHVIQARVVDDPVAAITRALLQPGVVWARPPSDPEQDLRTLVERGVKKLAPKTLVLVLDQFEEFLILADDSQRKVFNEFLQSLVTTPISGLRVLMILRSDYLGLLASLNLPPLLQHGNWEEVPPFTERDAMAFLRGSGLKFNPNLENEILAEAREVEDTKGTIRPITINLFGLVLSRFESLPKHYRPGTLLRNHLADQIKRKEVREVAPTILRQMITANGTKLPVNLEQVAKTTGIDANQIRGCLVQLGNEGMVRELDRTNGRWEIAHDFIASLYDRILAGWRGTAWQRARPWVLGSGIGLWLLAVVAMPMFWRDYTENQAKERLAELSFTVGGKPTERIAGSNSVDDANLAKAIPSLKLLSIKKLDLSRSQVTNVDALKGLTALQRLDLSRSQVTNLDALKGLTGLKIIR